MKIMKKILPLGVFAFLFFACSDTTSVVEVSSPFESSQDPEQLDDEEESEYDSDMGTLKDNRDGQTYRVVTIGKQTWMAENLNYADSNAMPNLVGASWCGGGDDYEENDCDTYGRLYTWTAAVNKDESECGYGKKCKLKRPVRGVCPAGWHLPSIKEWETLLTAVGNKEGYALEKLKSTSGWYDGGNGTDEYGFSILPANTFHEDHYGFAAYSNAFFWSSTELDEYENANCWGFNYKNEKAIWLPSNTSKKSGLSVRCIKN